MPDAKPLDPTTIAEIQAVLAQARIGNLQGARLTCEQAVLRSPNQASLRALLGALCCQSGDWDAAVRHLSPAHAANPQDITIAFNLASALIQTSAFERAETVCSEALAGSDPSGRIWRLRGFALQSIENYAAAAQAYEQVVAAVPKDFEAWNNLGNARADAGQMDGAIKALERASKLRPDNAPVRLNLASALTNAARPDEAEHVLAALIKDFPTDPYPLAEMAALHKQRGKTRDALTMLAQAAELAPHDADLQVKLGLEYVGDWDMEGGEKALARAIAADPEHAEAHLLTGLIYEHTNRADRFDALIESATNLGVSNGSIYFIIALKCRRDRDWQAGLSALDRVPSDVETIRTLHLRGQFYDRLGESDHAFAAFTAMNEALKSDPTDPVERAREFRSRLAADTAIVTSDWYHHWHATQASDRRDPIFLIGFPRSGTTLLDTMLMGHPDVSVMEELPPLNLVEAHVGGAACIATMDEQAIAAARDFYFEKVRSLTTYDEDKLLIDKSPLHLNKAALIHRLFPRAKFILALRHPADVVLSCFTTNFRLNDAMANFIDLDTSAALYDLSFACWERARRVLPIDVHTVRYEDLLRDTDQQLRALCDFLGLSWDAKLKDHDATARDRGVISTASYAQVIEPLYTRSAGRWTRYRAHLAPVLPVLAPWIDRFGYSQD